MPKISPDIGKRIRQLRDSVNPSQISFAKILRCSNTYLSDIERGRTKPSLEFLLSVSENTTCDLHWLLTGEGNIYKETSPFTMQQKLRALNKLAKGGKRNASVIAESKIRLKTQETISGKIAVRPVPILNTVPAGFPETPIDDFIIDWVLIPMELKDSKAFALIVTGKSMYPKIDDGEIIIISPQTKVSSGQIGAFRINGDVTIKKLLVKEEATYLIAENDEYPPIVLKEGDELTAIGRAVYQVKKIE